MKYISLFFIGLLFSSALFASSEPIVYHNVTVATNVQGSQCPATIDSDAAPEDVQSYTGFGDVNSLSGPGIRSCTNCAVDNNKNCVCETCYDNYLNF